LQGYRYRMKLVHAHFPINVAIPKDGSEITVKNFIGGKQDKLVKMLPGVTVKMNEQAEVKNELIFEGNDKASLSLCCAKVCQVCKIGTKDERKFLDGIFVSKRELINPRE
jgi:large subunit ribosomal protein L9e